MVDGIVYGQWHRLSSMASSMVDSIVYGRWHRLWSMTLWYGCIALFMISYIVYGLHYRLWPIAWCFAHKIPCGLQHRVWCLAWSTACSMVHGLWRVAWSMASSLVVVCCVYHVYCVYHGSIPVWHRSAGLVCRCSGKVALIPLYDWAERRQVTWPSVLSCLNMNILNNTVVSSWHMI